MAFGTSVPSSYDRKVAQSPPAHVTPPRSAGPASRSALTPGGRRPCRRKAPRSLRQPSAARVFSLFARPKRQPGFTNGHWPRFSYLSPRRRSRPRRSSADFRVRQAAVAAPDACPRASRPCSSRGRGRAFDLLEEPAPWAALDLEHMEDPERLAGATRAILGVHLDAEQTAGATRADTSRSGSGSTRSRRSACSSCRTGRSGSRTCAASPRRTPLSRLSSSTRTTTLGHVRLRPCTSLDISSGSRRSRAGATRRIWCNDFASGVLMPADRFADAFGRRSEHELAAQSRRARAHFGVDAFAAAVTAGSTSRLVAARRH